MTDWTSVGGRPLELGEGLRLVDGAVRWVDLLQGLGYTWDRLGEPELALTATRPLGVIERGAGGVLLAAIGTGLASVEDGAVRVLTDTGLDPARHRVNDGAFAPDGSFWFGTMVHDGSAPEGTLWRWEPGAERPGAIWSGIDIPNGPAFPDASTALVADSAAGQIVRVSIQNPLQRELFAEVSGGSPDGLHIDDEGRVWNAVWGASRLDVYGQDGDRLLEVSVPVAQPTSVLVLPGPQRRVIVTSATIGLQAPGPLDGHTITAVL